MQSISIKESLNPVYRRQNISLDSFQAFCSALSTMLDSVADGQSEPTQKGFLKDFLASSFYADYAMGIDEENMDLAIHLGRTLSSPVGIIVEVKSTTNKAEMVTPDHLNRKAMQELLLYYLRQRISKGNNDLRQLVITNLSELYIFDAHEFERLFYSDRSLREDFMAFEHGQKSSSRTELFFREIASPAIERVQADIRCTHVDLSGVRKALARCAAGQKPSQSLLLLYKLLSDIHLLKLPFQTDSNTLNSKFYTELLYILGLEEKKQDGKQMIVRMSAEERQEGSLVENTIAQLRAEGRLKKVADLKGYGDNEEEQLFGVALSLTISWVNRVLFLKLLEAQQVRFHKGDREKDYEFMNTATIRSFSELNTLFFQVMAYDYDQRPASIASDFSRVPYLNSSLFEISPLEDATLRINSLSQRLKLKVMEGSVLTRQKRIRTAAGSELQSLDYLLEFLSAYNFANDDEGEVKDDPKTIINAAVLGLIFEKLNGYRDGAVFTPGYITMYMCREVLPQLVVRKMNEHFGWSCTTLSDVAEKITPDRVEEARGVMDQIRICDPSVGSGHFLVSVLNEMLYIRYELGILTDEHGRRISRREYNMTIENDELLVTDDEGRELIYKPRNAESQRLQKTLFAEKRRVIENSLFGVDINQNSAGICRLRLWIELLKNAYYTEESNFQRLQTLPNIDINIKHGNSLVYRLALDKPLKEIMMQSGFTLDDYKQFTGQYKNAASKEEKHAIAQKISRIKHTLRTEISRQSPQARQLARIQGELQTLTGMDLFGYAEAKGAKGREGKINSLRKQEQKLQGEIDKINSNLVYRHALEWRIEFPELLAADGSFTGFDLMIGNPPYVQLQGRNDTDTLQEMHYATFNRRGDMYCLFFEQAINLLREGGQMAFITSNKWMRTLYGQQTRAFLRQHADTQLLIDLGNFQAFDKMTVSTNIIMARKRPYRHATQAMLTSKEHREDIRKHLYSFVHDHLMTCDFDTDEAWTILTEEENQLKAKIAGAGMPLGQWGVEINYGVKTGCNEAFIISEENVLSDILNSCESDDERIRTKNLIMPVLKGEDIRRYGYNWDNRWLICAKENDNIPTNYPAVCHYLEQFKGENALGDNSTTKVFKRPWWSIMQEPAYLSDFAQPKIIWGEISDQPKFAYDADGMMVEATGFIMTGEHLKYIYAFLNSSIAAWMFAKVLGTMTGAGTSRWKKYTIEQLPVPRLSAEQMAEVEQMVDRHLEGSVSVDDYAASIDTYFAQAIGLSEEEQKLIQNS